MPESDESARQQLLRFASHAVHEVAGPIDQISSLTALLVRQHRGTIDPDADRLLAHIEAARSRLLRVGAGLRKYFQVSTAEFRSERVDMDVVLHHALTSLSKTIVASGATIDSLPLPLVTGDRDLLVLLFEILLDNALKFRRPDTPPRIVISADPVFQVSDNGIGIDASLCGLVFDPFRKLHGQAHPGAGLGLPLAELIVKRHGGRIWLQPGSPGTHVFFELHTASEQPET